MNSSTFRMIKVRFGRNALQTIPRLRYATKAQREDFEYDNLGIHWEKLDEDLSFEGSFATGRNRRISLHRSLSGSR